MSQVTEHLREVATRDYGVDAAEAQSMSDDQLAQAVLRGIATQKYDVSAADLEGKDTRALVEVLLSSMVVDSLEGRPGEGEPFGHVLRSGSRTRWIWWSC